MNRERNLVGPNSYEKDLGLSPLDLLKSRLQTRGEVSWLDLCCGSGRALKQAAQSAHAAGLHQAIHLIGIDLVPMFEAIPSNLSSIQLITASVETWETEHRFDLITCVHGLHYIGDKLGLLRRASSWMKQDGLLLIHVDYRNLKLAAQPNSSAMIGRDLRRAGFQYSAGRHLLTRCGIQGDVQLPYRYIGADDNAGPNYTGQEAVDSYYERIRI